jgi:antitoxin (DNA-binding transcriptional repressor) of toxin-antitoxin stability system
MPVAPDGPACAGPLRDVIRVDVGAFSRSRRDLLARVRAGRAVLIVMQHGRVVARVVPQRTGRAADAFGYLRGGVLEHGDITGPDKGAWGEED